jgi:hypothetical protein
MAGEKILARYLRAMYDRNADGLVAAVRQLGELIGLEPRTANDSQSLWELMNDVAHHHDSPTIRFGPDRVELYIRHPRNQQKIRLEPRGQLIELFRTKGITTDWHTWDTLEPLVPESPPPDIPLPRPVARMVAPVVEVVAPTPAPVAPARSQRPPVRRPVPRRRFPVTTFVGSIVSIACGLMFLANGWWFLLASALISLYVALKPPRFAERAPLQALLMVAGAAASALFQGIIGPGIALMLLGSIGLYLSRSRRMQKLATVPIWVLVCWLVPGTGVDAAGVVTGVLLLISLRVRR